MANQNKGMNRILLDEQSIEEIRNEPEQAIETFEIYNGSGIAGRDYDIPTAQNLSNGVVLYYTPTPAAAEPPSPAVKRQINTKRRKRAAADDDDEGDNGPAAKRSTVARGGNPGLGALDALPFSPQVILGHGGNRGMLAPAFVQFARGIARNFAVLTFQKDRQDEQDAVDKRTAAFTYFHLDAMKTCLALGGRSRGARCAVRATTYSANRNLILWSYPFVRDMEIRKQELLDLPADARVLIIKGQKDWMGPELALRPLRQQMKAKTWQITVQEMDHRFVSETAQKEAKICNAIGVIAGIWLRGDVQVQAMTHAGSTTAVFTPWNPVDGTEMTMHYDKALEEVVWTGWTVPGAAKDQVNNEPRDIADIN